MALTLAALWPKRKFLKPHQKRLDRLTGICHGTGCWQDFDAKSVPQTRQHTAQFFPFLSFANSPRFGPPTAVMLHVTITASATSSALPAVSTGGMLAGGETHLTGTAPSGAFATILSSTGFADPSRTDFKMPIATDVAFSASMNDILSQLISGLLPTSFPVPSATPQKSTTQLFPSTSVGAILPMLTKSLSASASKSTAAVTERTNTKEQERIDDQDSLPGSATAPVVPQLIQIPILRAADVSFAFSGLAALALATLSTSQPAPAPVSKPAQSDSAPRQAQTLITPSQITLDSGAVQPSGTAEAGHLSFLLRMGVPSQRTIPPALFALTQPMRTPIEPGQTQPADRFVSGNTASPVDSQQTGLLPSEGTQNNPAVAMPLTVPTILSDPMPGLSLPSRADKNDMPVRLEILSSTGFASPSPTDLKMSIATAVASPASRNDILSQLISGLLPTSFPVPSATPQESTTQLFPSTSVGAILPMLTKSSSASDSKSTAAVTERTNTKEHKRIDDQDSLPAIATAPVVPPLIQVPILRAADSSFAFSGLAAPTLATRSTSQPAPAPEPIPAQSDSAPRQAQTLIAPPKITLDRGVVQPSATAEVGHLSFRLRMGVPSQPTAPPALLALTQSKPTPTEPGQTQPPDRFVWGNTASPVDSQQTGLLTSEGTQNNPAVATPLTIPTILSDPMAALPLPSRADKNEMPVRLEILPLQPPLSSLPLLPRSLSPIEPTSSPAHPVTAIKTGDNNPAENQQNDGGQTNRDQTPTRPGSNEPDPKQSNTAEIPVEQLSPLHPIPREAPRHPYVDNTPMPAATVATETLSNDRANATNAVATLADNPPTEQRDPKTVEPPPATKPALPALTQPPPATTASQIAIRLDATDGAGQVELRIRERAGEVQITVRSSDQGVATTLRQDLGDLVKRLETHTSGGDSVRQESPAPEPARLSIPHVPGGADAYSYFSDDSQQQHRQRQQHQQQQRQQATQASPDSLDELRSVLNDLNNGVYTS